MLYSVLSLTFSKKTFCIVLFLCHFRHVLRLVRDGETKGTPMKIDEYCANAMATPLLVLLEILSKSTPFRRSLFEVILYKAIAGGEYDSSGEASMPEARYAASMLPSQCCQNRQPSARGQKGPPALIGTALSKS